MIVIFLATRLHSVTCGHPPYRRPINFFIHLSVLPLSLPEPFPVRLSAQRGKRMMVWVDKTQGDRTQRGFQRSENDEDMDDCIKYCGSTTVPGPWEVWDWLGHLHDSLRSVSRCTCSWLMMIIDDDDEKTTQLVPTRCPQATGQMPRYRVRHHRDRTSR